MQSAFTQPCPILSLPLDVLENFLCSAHNFDDLYAVILTAKAFSVIYGIHPASIMRAVAYNLVGNSLPANLRLANWQVHKQAYILNGAPVHALPADEHITDDRLITWAEAKHLSFYARYAQQLENLFSRR